MAPLILVAEDNTADRALMCRRLERAGYETLQADTGAAAVEMTLAWRPDLVLMDLSMPDVDGLEAWRTITEMAPAPPPAIALSSVLLGDLRLMCADAGFAAFFSKPADFDKLLAAIASICAKSRAA